ncbi:Rho termination factor, N-terminal domain [Candidatus Electrothrix laxa]
MMQIEKIREKAEMLELDCDSIHLKKEDLIHAIQIAEGNLPCFLTATDSCSQTGCCWREDCLSPRWLEGTRLEEIKAELERLMETIENLKSTTNKLVKKKKRDGSKKAWKNTQKGIEDSWEEIAKALKELTARF